MSDHWGTPHPVSDLPLIGRLLVANPLLPDPNFDRTVVLVLAHGDNGALGVVLNRPSDMMLVEVLPKWASAVGPPAVVFVGGPVNDEAVIGLARAADGSRSWASDEETVWSAVSESIGTVDLELDPADVVGDLDAVRIFVGYAGWSAGQLESEIGAGAWWVVDADPDDMFGSRPSDLWRTVLRRQPLPLGLVAAYPPDPKMN
jgi:putative transcriptional regulator